MSAPGSSTIAELVAKATGGIAIEALWDGDTQSWFVSLYTVRREAAGFQSAFLHGVPRAGDLRLFDGQVPPWPEAAIAAQVGSQVARALDIPFHFPSPTRPEDQCPHWWELDQSYPCARCGISLLQDEGCPWKGTCHPCSVDIAQEAKVASWSPEERAAPRCSICGNPAVGSSTEPHRCSKCRDNYLTFGCAKCPATITIHRKYKDSDICSSCVAEGRLATLSEEQRDDIRQAVSRGMIPAIVLVRELLKCGIYDAQDVIALLDRNP